MPLCWVTHDNVQSKAQTSSGGVLSTVARCLWLAFKTAVPVYVLLHSRLDSRVIDDEYYSSVLRVFVLILLLYVQQLHFLPFRGMFVSGQLWVEAHSARCWMTNILL